MTEWLVAVAVSVSVFCHIAAPERRLRARRQKSQAELYRRVSVICLRFVITNAVPDEGSSPIFPYTFNIGDETLHINQSFPSLKLHEKNCSQLLLSAQLIVVM